MKKHQLSRIFITLALCAALTAALFLPVSAAAVSAAEAVSTLEALGLVRGTGNGFEPDRAPTRAEAAVMLLRLLGLERTALEAGISADCYYYDAGWADLYLGYARTVGLVKGISEGWFGSDRPISARDWATMVLRALGYREGQDFTWLSSLDKAEGIGLTHGEIDPEAPFLREDLALMSCTALGLNTVEGPRLIDRLYLSGAVSGEALENSRFSAALNAGRRRYSAQELYQRSVSATFYMETFEDEAALAAEEAGGNASGFFIAADGLALVSWHQLDGKRFARVHTTDGRVWPLDSVVWYDCLRDIAVVRVSSTDLEGNSARRFPWLELGNSCALESGEAVYAIGAPLGQRFSISEGIVSLPRCVVDDPAYPCILNTASISPGSSGGVLLNSFGDAVGVLYGSYIAGTNMHLSTPLDCLEGVDLQAAGTTLEEVYNEVAALRHAAQIFGEPTELELEAGEEQQVLISSDWPGQPILRFTVDDGSLISCRWGDFQTKQSIYLYIIGEEPGETEVSITLDDWKGGEDEEPPALRIHVTVTGEAEPEAAADAPEGEEPPQTD